MMNQNGGQTDEVVLAYQALKQNGQAMYFRDLINEVVKVKGGSATAHVLAEVHTRINMDSRFVHMGKGMWGLVEWSPQRASRYAEEADGAAESSNNLRREKLLAAIQQDYETAAAEPEAEDADHKKEDDDDSDEPPTAMHFVDLSEIGELDEEDERL